MNDKILEPLLSFIKIAILNFKPDNTKISINNHDIHYRLPSMYQGILRWGYGETRKDLEFIEISILFALKIIDKRKLYKKVNQLLFYVYCGINKLTMCYVEDNKYKTKLQRLEKIIKRAFESNILEIPNTLLQQKINFNYSRFENYWETIELIHINGIFKCIAELYKIQSLSIVQKYSLRENYIDIIKNTLSIKNENFVNKYLKNKKVNITNKLKNS